MQIKKYIYSKECYIFRVSINIEVILPSELGAV